MKGRDFFEHGKNFDWIPFSTPLVTYIVGIKPRSTAATATIIQLCLAFYIPDSSCVLTPWHIHIYKINNKESPLASKLSHTLQHRRAALIYVSKRSSAGSEHTHSGLWSAAHTLRPMVSSTWSLSGRPYLTQGSGIYLLCNPLIHVLILVWTRKDERLSRPSWLTYSGQFTQEVVTCPALIRVQVRESLPAKADVLLTMLWCQQQTLLTEQSVRKLFE